MTREKLFSTIGADLQMLCRLKRGIPLANTHWINVVVSGFRLCCYFNCVRVFVKPWSVLLRRQNDIERGIWYGGNKGGNSYSPWCIASYYILKLPNARDAISSTGTWKLNSSGKRLVLPIKLSVPLLCRSIYDFFLLFQIHLLLSQRECLAADYELLALRKQGSPRKCS